MSLDFIAICTGGWFTDDTAPSAPTITVAAGDGEIVVGYTPPADADYSAGEIEYDDGSTLWSLATTAAGSYTLSGLTNGVLYRITARAKDEAGNWSARSLSKLIRAGTAAQNTTYNSAWPRWVTASIFKHIDTEVTDTPKFFEGQYRKTNALPYFIEVRFNGPHIQQITKTNWLLKVEVDVLIQCTMSKDLFKLERIMGEVVNAMNSDISVYQYNESSASLVGCLQFKAPIKIQRFGQPREREETTFVSVRTSYEMNL